MNFQKDLKKRPYNIGMEKKGLKTRLLNMDMDKDIVTQPKEDLKTRPYNIGIEK